MIRWVQLSFLVAGAALLAAVLSFGPDRSLSGATVADEMLVPEPISGPAPAFSLPMANGKQVSLAGLRGRTVLVNFWATWCEPCIDELPHLVMLAQALRKQELTLVLISVDESFDPIAQLADRVEKMTGGGMDPRLGKEIARMLRDQMPSVLVVHDQGGKVSAQYGTAKYPETYLVDPAGQLTAKFTGPKPWGRPEAIETIKGLLHPRQK